MSFLDPILQGGEGGGPAKELATTGDPVNVGDAAPPVGPGRVLTTIDSTHATWQAGLQLGTGAGQAAPGDQVLLRTAGDWDEINEQESIPGDSDMFLIERASDGEKQRVRASALTAPSRLRVSGGPPVDVGASAPPPGAGYALMSTDSTHATWQLTARKYAVELYTPGGAPLTAANFEAALNAAVTAALDENVGQRVGGTVVIPRGAWMMTGTLVLLPRAIYQSIAIAGDGTDKTSLRWPTGFGSPCIDMRCNPIEGTPPGEMAFQYPVIRDMTIFGGGTGTTSTGVWIHGADKPLLQNVWISECGTALRADGTGQTNSAFLTAIFSHFGQSGRGCDLQGVLAGRFIVCDFMQNSINDILCRGSVQASWTDCSLHSGGPGFRSIEMSADNTHWNVLTFSGRNYHEAATDPPNNPCMLYYRSTTYGEDWFFFNGMTSSGWTTVLDLDASMGSPYVVMANTWDWSAGLFARARGCATIELDNVESPDEAPGRYDLDEVSRQGMLINRTKRGNYYNPRRTDARELTEALLPYALEIFDFADPKTCTLAGSVVTQIKGRMGSIATSPTDPQRYTYVTDGKFGGNGYIQGTNAANSNAQGTLATAYTTTDYPAIFVVAYVPVLSAVNNTFGPSLLAPTGNFPRQTVRYADTTGPDSVASSYYPTATGTPFGGTGITSPDVLGKTFCMCGGPQFDYGYFVTSGGVVQRVTVFLNDTAVAGLSAHSAGMYPLPGPTVLTRFLISNMNPAVGGDVSTAYLAFLKRPIPRTVWTQIFGLARTRFRIGMRDLIV